MFAWSTHSAGDRPFIQKTDYQPLPIVRLCCHLFRMPTAQSEGSSMLSYCVSLGDGLFFSGWVHLLRVEIMVCEAVPGDFLPAGAGLSVVAEGSMEIPPRG